MRHDRERSPAEHSRVNPADSLFQPEAAGRILERADALTPASERHWGRMSVEKMICHLSDSLRGPLGDRVVQPKVTFFLRTVVKWIALHTSATWPKGKLKTVPESDQEIGGTHPTEFAGDRAELKRLIERFIAAEQQLNGRKHPFFGSLTSWEWGRWGYRHIDHHLRQFGV
jgi:hypothetical protein